MKKTKTIEERDNMYPTYFETYVHPDSPKILPEYGIVEGSLGESYRFTSLSPVRAFEKNISQSNIKGSTVRFDYFFNYLAKDYDQKIQNLDELKIPNIYTTLKNGSSETVDTDGYITVDRKFLSNRKINKNLFMKVSFDRILVSPGDVIDYAKYTNIILSNEVLHSSEIKADQKKYPYGIKLTYSGTPSNNKLRNFLSSQGIYEQFINSYIYQNISIKSYSVTYDSYDDPALIEQTTTGYQSVNFTDFIESNDFSLKRATNNISLTLGSFDHSATPFGGFLKLALLKSFYVKMLSKYSRDFKSIVSGKSSYSEVLFYKIEKHVGNNLRRPIQTFYIPNVAGFFELIDTQVKTSKMYNYKITECRFVITNEPQVVSIKNRQNKSNILVRNKPSALIIEVPVYFENKAVSLPPPPPPIVKFSTQQNSDKKICLELSPNYGDYKMDFATLEAQDEEQRALMSAMTKGAPNRASYSYHSGKISYEVYRTTEPPVSLDSFSLNYRYDFDKIGLERSIRFKDPVDVNEKYYYMVRSYNSYGMKSNPSTIYEVELVQSGDDSVVNVKAYDYPKPKPNVKSISMRSLLQLIPSAQQTVLSMSDEVDIRYTNSFKNSLDDIKLGVAAKPLWGKKFKIRITSKDTGRKIDLNVKFDIKKKKSNQEL